MCFLYRQSISIVYESKFKYIYRYFIKIDRCFCEILQSLPLRKCGLKYSRCGYFFRWISHFPCGSVDWNFRWINVLRDIECHFPCGSVDWNLIIREKMRLVLCHFPCGSVDWNSRSSAAYPDRSPSLPLRKCGLKSQDSIDQARSKLSLPLRKCGLKLFLDPSAKGLAVTSLAEVWIEIVTGSLAHPCHIVTSLAEVWIEI